MATRENQWETGSTFLPANRGWQDVVGSFFFDYLTAL